jgi:hypothetical protein
MGKRNKKQKMGKSTAEQDEDSVRPDEVDGGNHLWQAIEPIWRWANNPLVADVLAAALIAGAQAISKTRPARDAAQSAVSGAEAAAETASESISSLRYAIAVAVGEIASRIVDAYEQEVAGRAGGGAAQPASPRRIG